MVGPVVAVAASQGQGPGAAARGQGPRKGARLSGTRLGTSLRLGPGQGPWRAGLGGSTRQHPARAPAERAILKISYCVQSYHHLSVITDSSAAAQAVAIDLRRQERDPVKLGHGTPRPNLGAAMRREPNPLLNAGPAPRHHSPQEHHGCRSRWRCLVCVSQEGG